MHLEGWAYYPMLLPCNCFYRRVAVHHNKIVVAVKSKPPCRLYKWNKNATCMLPQHNKYILNVLHDNKLYMCFYCNMFTIVFIYFDFLLLRPMSSKGCPTYENPHHVLNPWLIKIKIVQSPSSSSIFHWLFSQGPKACILPPMSTRRCNLDMEVIVTCITK